MIYPESVHYLYSLGNELKIGAKFGLERMQALATGLGHPESGESLIHVAGTNGKGSTCSMVASILQEAGHHTGLYTSPHLIAPTERIQVDGQAVLPDTFARAFDLVHNEAERLIEQGQIDAHPSYFETVTAMAFAIFRESCDISVIEVGLGGRLDATNIIDPCLCIITPISFDHEAYLGNTIESIAAEKAGILKPGVPVVLGRQTPAAATVIEQRANDLHCPVIRSDTSASRITRATPQGCSFTLDEFDYDCPLPGRHQVENAVSAILACRHLQIPEPVIQAGLRKTRWPGRLEQIHWSPDLILDGAHNASGACALAAFITEFFQGRPVWMVFGAMRDKAVDEVTAQLFPLADRLIVTAPQVPRALRPEAILDVTSHPNAAVAPGVADALELALQASQDTAVFFTGSLFLVGEVRASLLKEPLMLP